jgi:hypothetical protein
MLFFLSFGLVFSRTSGKGRSLSDKTPNRKIVDVRKKKITKFFNSDSSYEKNQEKEKRELCENVFIHLETLHRYLLSSFFTFWFLLCIVQNLSTS